MQKKKIAKNTRRLMSKYASCLASSRLTPPRRHHHHAAKISVYTQPWGLCRWLGQFLEALFKLYPSPKKQLLPLAIKPSSPPKMDDFTASPFWTYIQNQTSNEGEETSFLKLSSSSTQWSNVCQWTRSESLLQSRLEKWMSSSFAFALASKWYPH